LNSVTNWQALNSSGTRSWRFCRGPPSRHCRRPAGDGSMLARLVGQPTSRPHAASAVRRSLGLERLRCGNHRTDSHSQFDITRISRCGYCSPSALGTTVGLPGCCRHGCGHHGRGSARQHGGFAHRLHGFPLPIVVNRLGSAMTRLDRAEDLPDTFAVLFSGPWYSIIFSPVLTQSESKFSGLNVHPNSVFRYGL